MSDTENEMNYGAAEYLEASLQFFESHLFHDVQMSGIFQDSKTFADAAPNKSWSQIYASYKQNQQQSGFDLKTFVEQHFSLPDTISLTNDAENTSVTGYIESLWAKLQKQPDTQDLSSLVALSHPYIVPGGRFREIYYWDSYFTALGLNGSGRVELIHSMIRNFIELQGKLGCIPNGNRSYYHTRSQPPVLGLMIELALKSSYKKNAQEDSDYLQLCVRGMQAEYSFWMRGEEQLSADCAASQRVVRMPNGSLLNRYWDDSDKPRPESYREDIQAAKLLPQTVRGKFYRNIRAACESGWDFSSRWLANPEDLSTIQTTQIVPIDLNCLLYKLEDLLSRFYTTMEEHGRSEQYREKALKRWQAIDCYLWNEETGFYFDYDLKQDLQMGIESLAACLPLFVEIANTDQAQRVSQTLSDRFLVEGGLLTSLTNSPQQWDSPNGWAPLHWFAVVGLKNYQFSPLAEQVMRKWLSTVERQFSINNNIMEKYNMKRSDNAAKGGEYEVQHGFGWTNGVSLAFYEMLN